MKTRLLGAAVLIALAVLFLPMIFSGKSPTPGGDQAVSLAIPPAPDRDLQTKTMSLNPDAAVATSAPTSVPNAATPSASSSSIRPAAVTPGAAGQLATVNIGSTRPRDVETDPLAGKAPTPTTVTTGSGSSPGQPVIPMQNKPTAGVPAAVASKPATTQSPTAAAVTAAAVGHGSYTLNLSAYASAAGATNLQHRVRALGYPVNGRTITQAGQPRTLVLAGPFETRAAAEAARLKITQSIPGVPARLEQDASHDEAAAPAAAAGAAPPQTTTRAGGWAVQLAAMSNQADANALRDKLRANGFDGFVDTVQSAGKQLWRVRAGPQTQRADALRLRDQIKAKLGTDGNVVPVP
ncbi:SPOR domain-containing protein [Rhodanobacter koreensis]